MGTHGELYAWLMTFLHFGGWAALVVVIWQFRGMLDRVKAERERTTAELHAMTEIITQLDAYIQAFHIEVIDRLQKANAISVDTLQSIDAGVKKLVATK